MPDKHYEYIKEKKGMVSRSLMKLADVVDELNEIGLAVNGSALVDLNNKLMNDNFKVLVIGEFKNGKSTFINSLIGEKVLPAYSTPCTAVINEVVYGKEKKAMLYFKNPLPEEMSNDIDARAWQHLKKHEDGEIPPIELDVEDLEDFVAIPDPTKDQADAIKELPYSKVILEYPIDLCHDGVEIIDSPGLNENGTRTKVTEDYLDQADAILFVFRCPKIAGASEVDYITDRIHVRGHREIFFICNAINQIPEEERERLIRFGNKKLTPLTSFGESGIFYVNALGALKAKQAKDVSLLSETGMTEFEAALSEFLCNEKGKAKLMQIISPCNSFIISLQTQHIKSYIASLDQDIEAVEKKIRDALPRLDVAEKRKDLVKEKITLAIQEFQKEIQELMGAQYGVINSKLPKAVQDMDIENHMTANPFKQKSKKNALEKEVISKLEKFFESEMGTWIKTDLKDKIEGFIDRLEGEVGTGIDVFYENLDGFRYEVSGLEKSKDISGFERISATILGTVVGGPMYGALGASMGMGEITKRSAVAVGATVVTGMVAAFTPGVAAAAVIGSGALQLIKGGDALTKKYKKQLERSFKEALQKSKEETCKKYAKKISEDVEKKFAFVIEALDNEVQMERNKVDSLQRDREHSEEERKEKLARLNEIQEELSRINKSLIELEESIC